MPNLAFLTSPEILGKTKTGDISDFQISDQSLINQNCCNSRTSYDNDMKLGPVAKLDKRNTATSKKSDNDFISANCEVIVNFPIYG